MESPKILIVEDGNVLAFYLKKKLESEGYYVTGIASSGKEAIEMVEGGSPDLVLMDIFLKGDMDGVDAAKYITDLYDVPVVFLTGYSDDETLERAKITGPFGYIIKPFEDKELITNIEIAIYRHRMEKKLRARESLLSSMVNCMGDSLVITDNNGSLMTVTPSAQSLVGWDHEEVMGKPFSQIFKLFDEEGGERVEDPVKRVLDGDTSSELVENNVLLTKYGTKVPAEVRASPIRDDRNDVIGSVVVFNEISQCKECEKSLMRAKAESESVRRTKNELLANMSHDLRIPLNSIIGFSDILLTESFGPLTKKQSKYVENISTSGKYMLSIINGILEVSKIEKGKISIKYDTFQVHEVFEEIMSSLSPIASENNVTIRFRIDDKLETIKADRVKFKQILYNLLSNALKFTPEEGTVIIDARVIGDMASISVIDTGIGIPESHQDIIFKPFVQIENSVSKQYDGTGLGLSIVKKFVEIHGGEITLRSEVGNGSEITFTIPIDPEVVS